MQVMFELWCVTLSGRRPISVDPKQVSSTEHYLDARKADYRWNGDKEAPACTRIIMKTGKREYLVKGDLATVIRMLNTLELYEKKGLTDYLK